ncbi:hypothetical protein H6A11_02795 [Bifidobacterium pullorum subsp. saeculare]|uniref:hypothetical protein n=1 Tax=Bifidobacterium pullorum TaxID=78448 RepID=UPI00195E6109|nr:hypothetical protein [Bifidobacterium pullorum]MBM6695967.1 hypothetical protein [Bifidobacterium pullorum subsp. saeculare]
MYRSIKIQQRCLVHVLRNTRRDLTGRPRSEAGRELLRLARRVTRVADADEAVAWLAALNAWHSMHGRFIAERTMAEDAPNDPRAKRGRSWWYAHRRLRRACFRFVLLNHEGSLFAFCDPELAESGRVASTTNQLEDGVNAEIKRVPDAHRGLGEEHMRRRCEWVVYMRSANPDPEAFAAPDCRRPWRPGPATPRTTANPRRARGPMCSVPRPASTPTRTGSASERDGTDGHDAPDTPG